MLTCRDKRYSPKRKQLVIELFKASDLDVFETFDMLDYFRKLRPIILSTLLPGGTVPTLKTTFAVIDEYFEGEADRCLAKKLVNMLHQMNPTNPYLLSTLFSDPFAYGNEWKREYCRNLDYMTEDCQKL